jgi:tripartite-type tricarboxylate transporter receptor subunit TctC
MLLVNPANGINATLYKNLPFDFIRDIAPVAGLVRVPYKGAGPALADPIAGQVHVIFDNLPSSIGFIEGNKIRALSDPKMLERLAELGGKPIKGTPEDFGRVIAAETAKWEKVVKSSGAKVE